MLEMSHRMDIFAQESIPPAYVAWRPGTITLFVVPARPAGGIDYSESIPGLLSESLTTIDHWHNLKL
jgi:hypothetical protein